MSLKMKRIIILLYSAVALSFSWPASADSPVLPVTGTFINLPYQDVRNKYTNPQDVDNDAPWMWYTKVEEMKEMGMEYLVFMSVANECKAYYPSRLMEWHYPA